MAKQITRFGLVICLILSISTPLLACVGARPLAMGGAFIAVADDANAVYWNPAGLAQIPQGSMYTYMETVDGSINYQWFFSGVEKGGQVAYGISGINSLNGLVDPETNQPAVVIDDSWYQLSFAFPVTKQLSFGTNLKFYDSDLIIPGVGMAVGRGVGFDLAVHLQATDTLRIGLLSQDVLGSDIDYDGIKRSYINNVRPGIAWDITDDTTVAMDIYDLTGEAYLSAGIEKRFANGALRGGYYHDTWTAGFGLHNGGSYALDYCYIYDSHIISLSWAF